MALSYNVSATFKFGTKMLTNISSTSNCDDTGDALRFIRTSVRKFLNYPEDFFFREDLAFEVKYDRSTGIATWTNYTEEKDPSYAYKVYHISSSWSLRAKDENKNSDFYLQRVIWVIEEILKRCIVGPNMLGHETSSLLLVQNIQEQLKNLQHDDIVDLWDNSSRRVRTASI